MYMKDQHVYAPDMSLDQCFQGREMLVVSRHALASEIPYIMKNKITRLCITLDSVYLRSSQNSQPNSDTPDMNSRKER